MKCCRCFDHFVALHLNKNINNKVFFLPPKGLYSLYTAQKHLRNTLKTHQITVVKKKSMLDIYADMDRVMC